MAATAEPIAPMTTADVDPVAGAAAPDVASSVRGAEVIAGAAVAIAGDNDGAGVGGSARGASTRSLATQASQSVLSGRRYCDLGTNIPRAGSRIWKASLYVARELPVRRSARRATVSPRAIGEQTNSCASAPSGAPQSSSDSSSAARRRRLHDV
ncbi:MAG TPA: hypothetical protein VFO19_15595, partial [Vicinamibacterales bacterium]|nr:hypothetical protein [Vicinamibacterales bacterium]